MAFNVNFDIKWLIIPVVLLIGLGIANAYQFKENKKMETYQRQLSGQLTEKEHELQAANNTIGTLKSQLLSEKDLKSYWKKNKEEVDKEFDNFKERHKLKIKSMDRTIASLNQKLKGGNTTTVVVEKDSETCKNIESCTVSYSWEDNYNRFKLQDPNIFEKDNETFESNQTFKVYGEVWQQEDGSLLTRRLVLREVSKDADGQYQDIPGGKADIVESDFKYSNPPTIDEWHWTDLFKPRVIAMGSIEALPEGGDLRLGLGLEFFNWEGLGVNTNVGFDFDDPRNIAHYLGVSYSPRFFDFNLNLGIGASIGTPYYNFFQEYSFKIDLLFYLHD